MKLPLICLWLLWVGTLHKTTVQIQWLNGEFPPGTTNSPSWISVACRRNTDKSSPPWIYNQWPWDKGHWMYLGMGPMALYRGQMILGLDLELVTLGMLFILAPTLEPKASCRRFGTDDMVHATNSLGSALGSRISDLGWMTLDMRPFILDLESETLNIWFRFCT
jgi:hypothetical protein